MPSYETSGTGPHDPGAEQGGFDAPANLSWVAESPRLRPLAVAAADAMGVELLQDLIVSHAPFDKQPHIVRNPAGSTSKVPHHSLEMLLGVMPDYMANAQRAGLPPEYAYLPLKTILTAEGRSTRGFMIQPAVQLSRLFKTYADRETQLTDTDYAIIHNLVADTASKESDNLAVIDACRGLVRLGFSTESADSLIRNELFADSLVIDIALRPINALSVAQVEPALLAEICRLIPGENPRLYDIQASYTILYYLITGICPNRDIPLNDLLQVVRDGLARGENMGSIANSYIEDDSFQIEGSPSTDDPAGRRGKHFIHTSGPLELSPLPYRNERSFADGAADIARIALQSAWHREPVGEGFWIFDSASATPMWYSLGGETSIDVRADTVHHNYPQYPLGELSRSPVLYHAHPAYFEGIVGRGADRSVPPAAVPIVQKFFAATPSSRDYAMVAELMRSPAYQGGSIRSFIAHSTGTTEYAFPQDPERIEGMGQMHRQLRGEVMRVANWSRMLRERKWGGLVKGAWRRQDDVVAELVGQLSEAMPRGFDLKLIAPDIQVEL